MERTPPIAHYGTTLCEDPPPDGTSQADAPIEGSLRRTLRMLELAGFEPLHTNLYPGVGRQYIWRRGERSDADYLEKDTFTSYAAAPLPAVGTPRVGDTIFRLPHRTPRELWARWRVEDLVEPLTDEAAFVAGSAPAVVFRGPDAQQYELVTSSVDPAENHVVWIWTDPAALDHIADGYHDLFGLERVATTPFHGLADATILRRDDPAVTIGLLTPLPGCSVAPRVTDDVFAVEGFSHFRLGAPDPAAVEAVSTRAFPSTGDVAYVHFHHAYLELVATPQRDAAVAGAPQVAPASSVNLPPG